MDSCCSWLCEETVKILALITSAPLTKSALRAPDPNLRVRVRVKIGHCASTRASISTLVVQRAACRVRAVRASERLSSVVRSCVERVPTVRSVRLSCSSCRRCDILVRPYRSSPKKPYDNDLKHAHCVRQNYSANQRKTSPLTVSESMLSDDCLPRTVRLHWTRLVRCAAFYDRCWGLGAATARAKPQAAGDPVSSACGDADGPAV